MRPGIATWFIFTNSTLQVEKKATRILKTSQLKINKKLMQMISTRKLFDASNIPTETNSKPSLADENSPSLTEINNAIDAGGAKSDLMGRWQDSQQPMSPTAVVTTSKIDPKESMYDIINTC